MKYSGQDSFCYCIPAHPNYLLKKICICILVWVYTAINMTCIYLSVMFSSGFFADSALIWFSAASFFFFILVYCLTDTSTYTLAQLEMDTQLTILVCGLWPRTLGIVITKNCTLTLFFFHTLKFLPFHVALLNINQIVSSAYHPIPVLFCLTHPQSSRWERLYETVLAFGNWYPASQLWTTN